MDTPTLDTSQPFTRAQARRAGISDGRLRGPRFRRLFDGVYVDRQVPDSPALALRALMLIGPPGAAASHASAGRWHGCPLPALPGEHLTVLSRRHRFRRTGVSCHTATLPMRCNETADRRVSSPAQCFVELATQLSLVDLVVAGDWMVRKQKLTPEQLRSHCEASKHPGARAARAAAAYVRERVDSPMETRLRMLIVLAGLPEPEVNLTIRDIEGEAVRRYDLCWPGAAVIVEYDGRDHVQRIEQWEKDLARREAIDDEGWRILVVIADGIYKHPGQTLERVHRLLRARGLTGTPVRLRDDWRPHFPGHAQG